MSTPPHRDDDQTIDAARVILPGVHPPSPGRTAVAPARTNRFTPGDVLSNRFTIIRFLGSGGMGEVYEAEDRLLQGASIALKTITPDLALSPGVLQRFEREVLLARQITHPNVCPIYDINYHEDAQGISCFLSMKLLHGETLAARLDRQGQLSFAEALPTTRQIAAALQAAHGEGVIHRDIKPSNIMLNGAGADVKAVVMDFGLARNLESDLTLGGNQDVSRAHIIGTPGYMAPELLMGMPASRATDLYAFGLVVNEIFGGREPGSEAALKLAAGLSAPGVPPFLLSLTAACLGDDPDKRCLAFEQALTRFNLEKGSGAGNRNARPFWTRRRWLVAAASAGCAVGGTAVWEWDDIRALLHPLPKTRHVALMNWPPNSDLRFTSTLLGVIDALERELSRAEAFDSNLYVVSALTMDKSTRAVPSSLGANLMLASSVTFEASALHLTLEIMDAAATRLYRRKIVKCSMEELTALPQMAVRAAAELLGVSQYVQPGNRLKSGTDSPEAYRAFQDAEALRHQPNDQGLDAAIERYKAAIEQDGHYALALAMLAAAYYRLYWVRHDAAALDLAQANATTALTFDPALAQAHLMLGSVWSARGNIPAATEELGKAMKLDPADPQSMVTSAVFFAETNQVARAEEMFRRTISARPNYWRTYNDYGNFLRLQGRYAEALRAFRDGHLVNLQNSYILSNLGQVAFKSGQLKEAQESLQKSLAIRPSAVSAAAMAQLLRAEGQNADALSFAQKAVSLDPDDDENWREMGDCYSALPGRPDKARQAFAKAVEKAQSQLQTNDSDGPKWMLLALYQAKLQQRDAALISLRKADALSAIDLDTQLTRIRILELLGNRSDALNTLGACIRRGATKFEIGALPDLQSLRADPRYLTAVHPK